MHVPCLRLPGLRFPSEILFQGLDSAANGECCTEMLFQAPLPPDSLVLGLYRAPHPFCTVTASVGACVGARVCMCVVRTSTIASESHPNLCPTERAITPLTLRV